MRYNMIAPAYLRRIGLFFTLLILISLGNKSLQSRDLSQDVKSLNYVKVSDSVVMLYNKKEHGANMTCVALDDGLVFVDCGLFTEIASQFRADMEKNFNKKTLALFLTHAHIDHFFGMDAFNDVQVIASQTSKALFEAQLNIQFETRVEGYEKIFPKFGDALQSAKIFLPTKWFEKEMVLGSGKKQLVCQNTGGHTAGSSIAILESEKVIISGDLVQVDQYCYFGDPSTSMTAWIETLRQWDASDVEKICPGHGRMVNRDYIPPIISYFEEMISALQTLKKAELTPREVVSHSSLPKGYWPEGLDKPGWYDYAIARLYQEL